MTLQGDREAQAIPDVSHPAGLRLAVVAAVVSGIAVYLNGQAVRRFPSPTVYTTGKNLVAGVVLICVALAIRQRRSDADRHHSDPIRGAERLGLVAVAVVGGAVPFVLFFEGLARATSSDAAFIHKTLVVWVALLAVVLLGESLSFVHLAAVALLVVGQIALADGIGSLRVGGGEMMILLATLFWAVELILVKRLVASVPSSVVAASRIGGGAMLLVAWVAVTGRLDALASLSASQWAWLALTGCVLSVFVSVWFGAVARAQAIDVAAILVPGAIITGLINLGVGGTVAATQVVGWVLILIAGIVFLAGDSVGSERPALGGRA
jgi:drug/metabolite transporter (DMT)-like permease